MNAGAPPAGGKARALWIGTRRYAAVHHLQQQMVDARSKGEIADTILLLEHPAVVTLGRNANAENILFSESVLHQNGVDVYATARGGDVTYHGPGQLVCYPILDLAPDRCDVRRYVRALAEVMILILRDHGVEAGVVDQMIGVWADRAAPNVWAGSEWATEIAKVGAIGVRLSRWITMHGFALNLTTDLAGFRWIVPCGIQEHGVTSLQNLTKKAVSPRSVAFSIAGHLARTLHVGVESVMDCEALSDVDLSNLILGRTTNGRAELGQT
ncbi:MAG: lipoyl(octanoyl) transferase LipB [Polyangiaceae bacterium]|nr:lipoyl(octanoyl) transferase LipB [Polyangiaceae bacterium]